MDTVVEGPQIQVSYSVTGHNQREQRYYQHRVYVPANLWSYNEVFSLFTIKTLK